MMATAADIKVRANGITINCRIDGREAPAWITFSNSLAMGLHLWDPQIDALAAVAGVDHEARLDDIQCPTLFLAGTEDEGDFPNQVVDMHAVVPGSHLV